MSSCGLVFKESGLVTSSSDYGDVGAVTVYLKAMKTGDTVTDSHMLESGLSIALRPPANKAILHTHVVV